MGGIVEYLKQKYGFNVLFDEYTVDVGTGITQVLQNAPTRFAWTICNWGPYPITISSKPNVAYGNGLYVPPFGGVVTVSIEEDGEAVIYPVYAVASDDYSTLWVWETWES